MHMNFPAPTLQEKQNPFLWQRKVRVLSPAKINLYLNVTGRYKNGFHRIESIVNRINLFDEIVIKAIPEKKVFFFCDREELNNEDNLCVKAAMLMMKRYRLKCGFNILLKKNIPIGGGMGGGSSNGAFTLLGIDKLLKLNLSFRELTQIGEMLGSDVNFFLSRCKWAYVKGRGEKVIPLDIRVKLKYLLVYPNVGIFTARVYKNTKVGLTKFINNVNILLHALKRQDYLLVEKTSFNGLEKSAITLCKKLKEIKTSFRKEGFFCQMTGSGSTFFMLLDKSLETKKKVSALVRRMQDRGFWTFIAQTY